MLKSFTKIRVLPLTIFAVTMMLTVKIGDIWDGFDGLSQGSIQLSAAFAQTEADPAKAAQEKVMEDTKATPDSLKDEENAPQSKLITEDPTLLTQAEIDLLQQLAERRRFLESRERELEVRTGLLSAAESRIDKKVEELKILRETISGLIKTFDKQQDAKLASLVKIYENMKPKDAARIFEKLEMSTLLEVAERMKERKLAPVMAKMDPEKARDMTVELSQLRSLPLPVKPNGL
jgi:flagellar motility protein MotE (MotC chaperone)